MNQATRYMTARRERSDITPFMRHDPTGECDGRPVWHVAHPVTCPECTSLLCACEQAYGHDCEA